MNALLLFVLHRDSRVTVTVPSFLVSVSVSAFGRKCQFTFGKFSVSAESRSLLSALLSASAESKISLSVDLYFS